MKRSGFVGVLVVAAALLAGCGGGSSPTSIQSLGQSPSTPPTASSSPSSVVHQPTAQPCQRKQSLGKGLALATECGAAKITVTVDGTSTTLGNGNCEKFPGNSTLDLVAGQFAGPTSKSPSAAAFRRLQTFRYRYVSLQISQLPIKAHSQAVKTSQVNFDRHADFYINSRQVKTGPESSTSRNTAYSATVNGGGASGKLTLSRVDHFNASTNKPSTTTSMTITFSCSTLVF